MEELSKHLRQMQEDGGSYDDMVSYLYDNDKTLVQSIFIMKSALQLSYQEAHTIVLNSSVWKPGLFLLNDGLDFEGDLNN